MEGLNKNKYTIIIRDHGLFQLLSYAYEESTNKNKSQFFCDLLEAGLKYRNLVNNDKTNREQLNKLLLSVQAQYKHMDEKLLALANALEAGFKILISRRK